MGLERMGTHSESCYKWHLECAVSRYEALRARVDELEAQLTAQLEVKRAWEQALEEAELKPEQRLGIMIRVATELLLTASVMK